MYGTGRHIFSGALVEEVAGCAQAVVAGGWVLVSATAGIDDTTGEPAEGVVDQAERALDTIEAALRRAGSGLQDVVRVRTFLANPEFAPDVTLVLKRRVGAYYPASTSLHAGSLVPGALVEIEVEALLGFGEEVSEATPPEPPRESG